VGDGVRKKSQLPWVMPLRGKWILWPFPCAISIDNQARVEFIAQVEGLMECPERKMSEGKDRVEAKEGKVLACLERWGRRSLIRRKKRSRFLLVNGSGLPRIKRFYVLLANNRCGMQLSVGSFGCEGPARRA
jgi:hypothetical protein